METKILIDNLKCGGCANTIRKNISTFSGVEEVMVEPEKEMVTIRHHDALDINAVKEKLHQLGYPEKGSTEGFDKLSSGIKSYISCVVGKLSGEENPKN